jgi:FdhE protein
MVRFDPAVARRLFDAVDEVLRNCGEAGVELSRLRAAIDDQPAVLEELMTRAAFDPDQEYLASLAGRLELPAGLLLLVGRVLAAPFVTRAAGRIEQPDASQVVSDGYCPVCDSPPGLAQLRADDGKRVLHCSLCGHAWPFGRLVCPFCGSGEQAALGKLTVEGEDARWIEACRHCKQYLKTVDQRRLPPGQEVLPLVEEVAGLYLDLLAEKEGYRSDVPYAAVQGAGVREQGSEGRRAGGR